MYVIRRIEEGRAVIFSGRHEPGVKTLREALTAAVETDDSFLQFYAHYGLWKAHLAIGDKDRAAHELQSAQFFVRHVDESTPEADEVRKTIR